MTTKEEHEQLRKELKEIGKQTIKNLKKANKNMDKIYNFYKEISL